MEKQETAEGAEQEFSLGRAALDREDTLAALKHLERALRLQDNPAWHSYLGYCIAKERGQYRKGVELCQNSLAEEPGHPEHIYNLARVHLVTGDKMKALQVLREGMTNGGSPEIVRLLVTLGQRSPLLFPSLSRTNPLNRYLGMLLKRLGLR